MGDNKKDVDTIGLTWSVQARKKGSAQIRLRLGPDRQVSISTGHKSPDALSETQQVRKIREWLEKNPLPSEKPTFEAEVKRFITLKYEGRKPKTVEGVERDLERLRAVLGVTHVHEVTKALCEARKGALRGSMAAATWRDFLSRAAKFFRFEVGEGHLAADPLVNFMRPSKKDFGRREDVWEDERYTKTRDNLSGDDREIFILFRETAMDPSDIFHFNPKKHLVKATDPDTKRAYWKIVKVRQKAKSDKEKIDQPLSTTATKIMLREKWFDFSRYSDADSFGVNLLKRIKKAQRRAGFKTVLGVKALRHTFASYHAKRYLEGLGGPPMEVLRKWMGHAEGSRTLETVYMHTQSSGKYQE